MSPNHPRHALDEHLGSPVRLSIVALLASVQRAEFALVRDTIEVSDSVLSKQATALEAAGYLKVTKGHVGKRPRTWFSLTAKGRAAFERHLTALRQIVQQPGE